MTIETITDLNAQSYRASETETQFVDHIEAAKVETDPTPNGRVLVISLGTQEDLFLAREFQYGDEIGAPRLEMSPPYTQNLGQLDKIVKSHIQALRTPDPETGKAVLGPDERLDKILVETHGAPLTVYIGGMDNQQVIHISGFSFLAKYTKEIEFAGCNVGADITEDDLTKSVRAINTCIIPFTSQNTAIQLNSTYGMLTYGDYSSRLIDPCKTDEENIDALVDAGVRYRDAKSLVTNDGLSTDQGVRDLAGPGGNSYKFIPDDKDGDGIIGPREIRSVHIKRNGDLASRFTEDDGFKEYTTNGIEFLHQYMGGEVAEDYLPLNDETIQMPNFTRFGLADDESGLHIGTRLAARFNQAIDEGLSYDHPKSRDMIISWAKFKRNDPLAYEGFRQSFEASTGDKAYFQLIDQQYDAIYGDPHMRNPGIPSYHGTMLDNPQVPGQY